MTVQEPTEFVPTGRDGYVPPAETREMWRTAPVREVTYQDGRRAWLVTGMEEVRTVLSDPRFSRAEARSIGARISSAALFDRPSMLDLDPPEHSRLRRLVASAFTARRIRALRPRIQEITDGLLDDLAASEQPADLNALVCFPLPIAVICEILGVPYDDRERFRAWADRLLATSGYPQEEIEEALYALASYIAGLVEAKRRHGDGSLLQALVEATDEHGRLTEEELVTMGMGLLVAGHETTANMFSKGMVALFDHPGELRTLIDGLESQRRSRPHDVPVSSAPSVTESAVDEVLRYVALGVQPVAGAVRATTCTVELGGVTIPAGSPVLANTQAANRDPGEFPEPERLDLARSGASSHVAFGFGPHHCLGAQLARIELDVAFSSLLSRFPTLRLGTPVEQLAYREGMLITGLRELPVTW